MHIHAYVKQGNITAVAQQFAKGVDINYRENDSEQTPLMVAVSSPDASLEMVRFLLDNGADVDAVEHQYHHNVLALAVQSGNLAKVKMLVDAGADLHYQRPHGYNVTIDALHGRKIAEDSHLIELLTYLIDQGAGVNNITSYGESALRVASRIGRFDAVKLLLDAGADLQQLQWTEFMQTVVFGTVEDVQKLLDDEAYIQQADLYQSDYWERTPWLLCLQVGDIEKAQLLLSAGSNQYERGRCGKTPLMYPLENDQVEMLQWLIEIGCEVEEMDDFATTPLMVAAESGATQCVAALLKAGADPGVNKHYYDKAIHRATNLPIIRMLVAAGEDLDDINEDMRRLLTGVAYEELLISQEDYLAGKEPRFGKRNPQIMDVAFWKAMVRNGGAAWSAKGVFDDTDNYDHPVWCYSRFGRTITELGDGRIIEIAGEHEDFYDPDFCIYNDVVVYDGKGDFTIFGYPQDVFPPTDFHSATLVGEYIYIIGSLGYRGQRNYQEIPVYRLHCDTYKIEKVTTKGDKPGWISRHKAFYEEPGTIYITGGKVCVMVNDKEEYVDNSLDYALDLATLTWICLST